MGWRKKTHVKGGRRTHVQLLFDFGYYKHSAVTVNFGENESDVFTTWDSWHASTHVSVNLMFSVTCLLCRRSNEMYYFGVLSYNIIVLEMLGI